MKDLNLSSRFFFSAYQGNWMDQVEIVKIPNNNLELRRAKQKLNK
jgi:hypothetical protein